MDAEIIIVGSGAAGAAAAFGLAGQTPLVIDVGHDPPPAVFAGFLEDARRAAADLHDALIGRNLESLHNVFYPYLSPKLKAPLLRFVTADAARLTPVESSSFQASISLAKGGLANVWGAGLYRFVADDLAGFPIGISDIEPHYDTLTREIGISGAPDDLVGFFGSADGLLPPLQLPPLFDRLLERYNAKAESLRRAGLWLGRSRIAVLSRPYDGRPAYAYDALDFFQSGDPAIYSPRQTIEKLHRLGKMRYRDSILVTSYREHLDGVTVFGRDLRSDTPVDLRCRTLVLAAGALNTARIVLSSRSDYTSELPILDNAVAYIPLIDLRRVGVSTTARSYPGAVLNAIYRASADSSSLQMSLYGLSGALRSDYLFDFPVPTRDLLPVSRELVPAMLVAQLFFPSDPHPANRLRLQPSGVLTIDFGEQQRTDVTRTLLRIFRRLGLLSLPSLVRHLEPGSSFHYAGTLPMKRSPSSPYETDIDGRLAGTRAVFIADAAVFPRLPSKNHSFTMMANALRVASRIAAASP